MELFGPPGVRSLLGPLGTLGTKIHFERSLMQIRPFQAFQTRLPGFRTRPQASQAAWAVQVAQTCRPGPPRQPAPAAGADRPGCSDGPPRCPDRLPKLPKQASRLLRRLPKQPLTAPSSPRQLQATPTHPLHRVKLSPLTEHGISFDNFVKVPGKACSFIRMSNECPHIV